MSAFEDKSKKVIDLLDEKIKDSSSRKLFESIKDDSDISQSNNFLQN